MPRSSHAKHIIGSLIDTVKPFVGPAKPYIGNALYHASEFAKKKGAPAGLAELALNAGLGWVADYNPDTTNPTFGDLPMGRDAHGGRPLPSIPQTIAGWQLKPDQHARMHAGQRDYVNASGVAQKQGTIIDFPDMRRHIPRHFAGGREAVSPMGPYSSSDFSTPFGPSSRDQTAAVEITDMDNKAPADAEYAEYIAKKAAKRVKKDKKEAKKKAKKAKKDKKEAKKTEKKAKKLPPATMKPKKMSKPKRKVAVVL